MNMEAVVTPTTIRRRREDDRVHGSEIPQHRGPDSRRTRKIEASFSSSGENRARCDCGSPAHPMPSYLTTSTNGDRSESLPPLIKPKVRSRASKIPALKGNHKMVIQQERREAGEDSDKWSCATSTGCGRRVTSRHQVQNNYQSSPGSVYPLGGGRPLNFLCLMQVMAPSLADCCRFGSSYQF